MAGAIEDERGSRTDEGRRGARPALARRRRQRAPTGRWISRSWAHPFSSGTMVASLRGSQLVVRSKRNDLTQGLRHRGRVGFADLHPRDGLPQQPGRYRPGPPPRLVCQNAKTSMVRASKRAR